MNESAPAPGQTALFGYPDDDFPFYNGQPLTISPGQWLGIVAAVALGFACLTVPVPILLSTPGVFIRTLLFPVIPLVVFRVVAGPQWVRLFRHLQGRDFGWMLAFAVLNLLVTVLIGTVVMQLFGADTNLVLHGLTGQTTSERELFFLRSIPQLFGEEVLTILPFLAVLSVAYGPLHLSRNTALLLAWLVSSVIFALAHLPSYNWNWIQCIVVIGSARLVLTLAYLKTRNILVSTGAHIVNDWIIFGLVLLGSTSTSGA